MSVQQAHTPGPWTADLHHTRKQGGRTYAMVRAGNSIVPLAAVVLGVEGRSEDEGRANARMIGATTDLLQALHDLAYEVQGEVEHIGSEAKHAHERALAAIAKAENH